jgi:hypothetical protein
LNLEDDQRGQEPIYNEVSHDVDIKRGDKMDYQSLGTGGQILTSFKYAVAE